MSSADRGSRRRPSARRPRTAPRRASRGCPHADRRGARRSPSPASRRSRAAAPAGGPSGSGAPKRRESSTANCRPADAVSASRRPRRSASLVPPLGVGHAEHRAQDHLERHALHARVDGERLAFRPRLDVTRDDLADRRLVRAHARAVERRQHEPPAGQVVAPLEQQERARADDRQQRERPAGRQAVLGVAVERSDRLGSESITIGVRNPRNRTLNVSPNRRRQDSRNEIGRSSQRSVCTIGGSLGPAGRAVRMQARVSRRYTG